MKKYTEQELALAINDLIVIAENFEICGMTLIEELNALREKHEVIEEICTYGPDGPVGIGLGNFGGHAVGD